MLWRPQRKSPARRDHRKRDVVRADEKLTALVEFGWPIDHWRR
jgi:hypothetical protein